MTAHAKYLFDTDFENPLGLSGKNPDGLVASQADLDHARDAAFREGVEEGCRIAREEAAQELNRHLARLCEHAATIVSELHAEREKLAGEAAAMALAAARQLAPALIAREPHFEVLALLQECIANLSNAPHLAVQVPAGDIAALQEKIEKMTFQAGYEGRVIVLEEPGMEQGDCRIEWADGGIARDGAALDEKLRDIVARRFAPTQSEPMSSSPPLLAEAEAAQHQMAAPADQSAAGQNHGGAPAETAGGPMDGDEQ